MSPLIASLGCVLFCLWLLRLDLKRSPMASRWLWDAMAWAFFVATRPPSFWVYPGLQGEQMAKASSLNGIILFILIVLGLCGLYMKRVSLMKLFSNRAVAFLYCFGAVSIFWANEPGLIVTSLAKQVGHLIMILLILTDGPQEEALVSFFRRMAFLLVPLNVLVIRYIPEIGKRYDLWSGQTVVIGATWGKNTLAVFASTTAIFLIWNLLFGKKEGFAMRAVVVAILAGDLYLVRLADSDNQTVTVLVGAIIMFATRYTPPFASKLVRNGIAAFALISLFMVASQAIYGIGNPLVTRLQSNPTFAGRMNLWEVLRARVDHPLIGSGFEGYWTAARLAEIRRIIDWGPNQAHNGYLEMYLNLGLVGLICLLVIVVSAIRKMEKTVHKGGRVEVFTIAIIISFMLTNLTEGAVFRLSYVWLIFLLSAVYISMKEASLATSSVPKFVSPLRVQRPPLTPIARPSR